jgi:hypothetical protein
MRRRNPAIVLGDANSVLRLGPKGVRKDAACSQSDSDVIAHFVQVNAQISRSSWLESRCELPDPTSGVTGRFPSLESFVYVAVYFRQLFATKDRLFDDACEAYLRTTGNALKAAWVYQEQKRANGTWKSKGWFVDQVTTEELFGAMIYGAHLVHSRRGTKSKPLATFRNLLATTTRERLLFEMHGSLRRMMNHVSKISAVIYQDYSHWVNDGLLPRPDVMWHESLFVTETTRAPVGAK